MKTSQIFLFALMGCTMALAQTNSFPTTGNVGIGTTNPSVPLHINNGNDSYGAILANADESSFSLYTKTLDTQPAYIESFRLGLKHNLDENNGYISFYRGGGTSGGYLGLATNGSERIRISENGHVGIGTSNPGSRLEVNDGEIHVTKSTSSGNYRINFRNNSASFGFDYDGTTIGQWGAYIATSDVSKHFYIAPAGVTKYTFRSNGNLGVGTTNPTAKLQVMGGIGINTGTSGNLGSGSAIAIGDSDTGLKQLGDGHLAIYTNNAERMQINNAGNIGIGTTDPGTFKLAVNGNVRAKEIKVETGWSDFVFEKGYDLPTLEEVEEHIKEKGHLKDIPSAEEVAENGILLGEMDSKLLQKIEELTLYTIAQEKRIKNLEKENETLKFITERVAKIEALVKAE